MKEKKSEKRKRGWGESREKGRKKLSMLTLSPHAHDVTTCITLEHVYYYMYSVCMQVCMYLVLFNLLLKDVSILSWWREGH